VDFFHVLLIYYVCSTVRVCFCSHLLSATSCLPFFLSVAGELKIEVQDYVDPPAKEGADSKDKAKEDSMNIDEYMIVPGLSRAAKSAKKKKRGGSSKKKKPAKRPKLDSDLPAESSASSSSSSSPSASSSSSSAAATLSDESFESEIVGSAPS